MANARLGGTANAAPLKLIPNKYDYSSQGEVPMPQGILGALVIVGALLQTAPGASSTNNDRGDSLKKLQGDFEQLVAQHEALLNSEWLWHAKGFHLQRAQTALQELASSEDFAPKAVDDFHCGVRDLIAALETVHEYKFGNNKGVALQKSSAPRLKEKDCSKLIKELERIEESANERQELRSALAISLKGASRHDAVAYGSRMMVYLQRAAYEKPLESVSGGSTIDPFLSEPLERLSAALQDLDSPEAEGLTTSQRNSGRKDTKQEALSSIKAMHLAVEQLEDGVSFHNKEMRTARIEAVLSILKKEIKALRP